MANHKGAIVTLNYKKTLLSLNLVFILSILLNACGNLPPIIPQRPAPQSDNHSMPNDRAVEQANAFLAAGKKRDAASAYFAAAQNHRSPYRERLILQAAELASIFKDNNLTQRYLAALNVASLNQENQARYRFTQAQLALNDRNYSEALRLLPQRVANLPTGLADKILNARMNAAQASGNKLTLVQELVLQENRLNTDYEKKLNNDRIWGHIQQMPLEQINQGRKIAHPELRAWLDLAYLEKTNQHNESGLKSSIKNWQNRNPNHPANTQAQKLLNAAPVAVTTPYREAPDSDSTPPASSIPGSPKITSSVETPKLKAIKHDIAIILPRQGKLSSVGNTILAGIKAASNDKLLNVFDSNSDTINNLYQKAIHQGARIVIGPFDKSRIASLAQNNLNVPVLSLNYLINNTRHNNLYQFGLLPEDEAVQMAQYAINQNKKRVALLTPDSKWGKRLQDAMRTAVIERGGKVAVNKSYKNGSNDFSYISQSLATHNDEFDVILLAASPKQAQAIYPSIRQQLKETPIYATSHVFNGVVDAGRDANLDGLMFTETPWVLTQLSSSTSMPSMTSYPRLFALGMDAMLLANQLDTLKDYSSALNGRTGRIRLSRDGTLHRELLWAKFVDGKPVPVR